MRALRALLLLGLMPLAACSKGEKQAPAPDPMMAAALAAPLMTDPDLSALNRAGVALTGIGVPSAPIPTDETSPEARSAALAEAERLAGGALKAAPAATASDNAAAAETAMLSWQQAFRKDACMARVRYSAIWAARLPDPLGIFPRGHVQQAAGSDEAGCALRAVTFRSPVEVQVLLDFYATRAKAAGFALEHRADEQNHALKGNKRGLAFVLYVRPGPDGLSEADLLTSAD